MLKKPNDNKFKQNPQPTKHRRRLLYTSCICIQSVKKIFCFSDYQKNKQMPIILDGTRLEGKKQKVFISHLKTAI